MRRVLLTILFLTTTALVLAPAAEAGPFYIFGKLGSTDASVDVATGFDSVLDGDDNSAGYGVGFKTGRHMAFQIEYHDLGNIPGLGTACAAGNPICEALPLEADSAGISVSIVPHVLLTQRIRIYAKLGYISWDSDISAVSDLGSQFINEFSDEDLVYGAGLRFQIPGPFGAFAEYERIADAFDTVAIGASWGF